MRDMDIAEGWDSAPRLSYIPKAELFGCSVGLRDVGWGCSLWVGLGAVGWDRAKARWLAQVADTQGRAVIPAGSRGPPLAGPHTPRTNAGRTARGAAPDIPPEPRPSLLMQLFRPHGLERCHPESLRGAAGSRPPRILIRSTSSPSAPRSPPASRSWSREQP